MTVVNFCFTAEKFFAVADAAVSAPSGERLGITTKLHALSHLHSVVAGLGTSLLLARYTAFVLWASEAKDIHELATETPSTLRLIWSEASFDPARAAAKHAEIILAGVDRARQLHVCHFTSVNGFQPFNVPQGVYLLPALRDAQETKTQSTDETAIAAPAVSAEAPTAPSIPWHVQTQRCVSALRQQRTQAGVGVVGGRVWGLLMTPGAIHQHEIFDLDEALA